MIYHEKKPQPTTGSHKCALNLSSDIQTSIKDDNEQLHQALKFDPASNLM